MKRVHILLVVLAVVTAAVPFKDEIKQMMAPAVQRLRGKATVADRLEQYGAGARSRLKPHFDKAGVEYPPARLVLVGLKQEKRLEVWARDENAYSFALVREYPILGTSGTLGPKLREGDMQMPEGLYEIESLNPNSGYHLSLRLNYPNAFDLQHAKNEGRKYPGSDIMIHGGNMSIGCLAMGDEVAEELFVLAADTGLPSIEVILAPVDLRSAPNPLDENMPEWTAGLYARIREQLQALEEKKEK